MAQLQDPTVTGLSAGTLIGRYERDRLGFLLAAARQYGGAVTLAPGTVLLNDPAAIHEVLRRTNTDFLLASDIMRNEVSGERGDPDTEAWLAGRRAVQSGMTPQALREHRRWLAVEVDRLAAAWLGAGRVLRPLADLESLTARSFARFCFGSRPAADVPERTGALLAALAPVVGSPFQLPRILHFLPRYRRVFKARQALERALETAIGAPGSGGLVEAIDRAGLDRAATVRMLVSTSVAAYRVPAAAAAWTLLELARHRAVADDCADAATETARDTPPAPLTWAISEALRLWPPTWLIFRRGQGQQACGQWRIPADAAVMISPYVVHRTAGCYDAPDEFRPERWAALRPEPGAYLPYGGGSRWCVGNPLAEMELATIVAGLIRRIRFEVAGQTRPQVLTTMVPQDLILTARPR